MDGQPLPLKKPKERFIIFEKEKDKILNSECWMAKDKFKKKMDGRPLPLMKPKERFIVFKKEKDKQNMTKWMLNGERQIKKESQRTVDNTSEKKNKQNMSKWMSNA